MKRASKVSNVHGEVHVKQKQRLTIASTGKTLPQRKQHATNIQLTKTELPHNTPKKPNQLK